MPDPEHIFGPPAGDAGDPPSDVLPLAWIACPVCAADLTSLPRVARFCHHCGSPVSISKLARQQLLHRPKPCPPAGPLFSRPRWLFNLWCACTDSDPETTSFIRRSKVLLAYGKSMFNLGWRYEHAVGARRNLHEAARCYWKAARLGDPLAAGRLGRETVADPDGDETLPVATSHPAPAPVAANP